MLPSNQMITPNVKDIFVVQRDENFNVIIQPNDNIHICCHAADDNVNVIIKSDDITTCSEQ
jgi:hypothetical protein